MKAVIIVLCVLVGIGLGISIYFLSQSKSKTTTIFPTASPFNQNLPSKQDTPPTFPPSPPADIVQIPEAWKTFTSQQYGFSLRYPADVTHDTIGEGERFYKLGPTQKGQTEMYDGINLLIKSGSLEGKSFAVFTQEKYVAAKNEPAHSRVGEKTPITIARIQGVSFTVSGLGDWTAIYLPKGTNQYIEIINGTVEPANREQTLHKTVDIMLSSLKLL